MTHAVGLRVLVDHDAFTVAEERCSDVLDEYRCPRCRGTSYDIDVDHDIAPNGVRLHIEFTCPCGWHYHLRTQTVARVTVGPVDADAGP